MKFVGKYSAGMIRKHKQSDAFFKSQTFRQLIDRYYSRASMDLVVFTTTSIHNLQLAPDAEYSSQRE